MMTVVPKIEELGSSASRLREDYIKSHYPDFYELLMSTYKNYKYEKFSELVYCYYASILSRPVCPICGADVRFLDIRHGYQKFCSRQCAAKSQDTKDNFKETVRAKYGVDRPCQNRAIKEKMIKTYTTNSGGMGNAVEGVKEKMYETMRAKYGTEHAMDIPGFKEKAAWKSAIKMPETRAKIDSTVRERYGSDCITQVESVKQKIRTTNLERYGGTGLASSVIQSKIKKTKLERYGDPNYTNREQAAQTVCERWGVDKISEIPGVRSKTKSSYKSRFLEKHPDILNVEYNNGTDSSAIYTVRCKYSDCPYHWTGCDQTFIISSLNYWSRVHVPCEMCTKVNPVKGTSNKGTFIETFIMNILDEYNIKYVCNVRDIISPYELDVYIPDKKIAVECNGVYWHSFKSDSYHSKKWQECKTKGVQLLTLWEDWIVRKPDIVRSLVLSKLGLYESRLGARQCEVGEISAKECNEFLERNHIQGHSQASVHVGLKYGEGLVGVMTFTRKRACQGSRNRTVGEWELSRFCTKKGVQVVGGASKLMKYFIKTYSPRLIYSFSSNDVSDGKLYEMLGFVRQQVNKAYWYIDPKTMKRYHRSSFSKDSIVRKGWKKDKTGWTEREVMKERGYFQIYDSGQTKWEYRAV